MDTLFPIETTYPDGFAYFPEFVSEEEEKELLREISSTELHAFTFQGYEARRKVASFGYDYNFDDKAISKGKPIPAAFEGLIEKVATHITVDKEVFKEFLITEYPVGSVINWHRDAFPFDLIAGISLFSDCLFKLRPYEKSKQNRASVISIPLRRRSLYIIKGPARMDWQHSIAPVKKVRYSITLRTLKN